MEEIPFMEGKLMNTTNPKDAIAAFVSAPSVILADIPDPSPQGWLMQQRTGGLEAKPETIRFVKERRLPRRQLHYVTFENTQGEQWHSTCYVIEDSDGTWKVHGAWQVRGGSGGAGRGPKSTSPRVDLGGGEGEHFHAGGLVQHNGHAIVRVRLLSANGVLLEDSVDDDIVLFLDDRWIDAPLQAQLYNRQGMLVGTHQVLPG
jgi:hypothetical protein